MTLYHADQVQEAVNDSFSEGIDHRHGDPRCPVMPDEEATAEQIAAALRADPTKALAVLEALGVVVWDDAPDTDTHAGPPVLHWAHDPATGRCLPCFICCDYDRDLDDMDNPETRRVNSVVRYWEAETQSRPPRGWLRVVNPLEALGVTRD